MMKSRKLWFTIACLAIGTAIELLGKNGLSENMVKMVTYLGGLYVFSNNLSAMAFAYKAKSHKKDEEVQALADEMITLKSNQFKLEQNAMQVSEALGKVLK